MADEEAASAPLTVKGPTTVDDPLAIYPAEVMRKRSVNVANASLSVPRIKFPAEDEAYQCLLSAPAPLSLKRSWARVESVSCKTVFGVVVPIPSRLFVSSQKKIESLVKFVVLLQKPTRPAAPPEPVIVPPGPMQVPSGSIKQPVESCKPLEKVEVAVEEATKAPLTLREPTTVDDATEI